MFLRHPRNHSWFLTTILSCFYCHDTAWLSRRWVSGSASPLHRTQTEEQGSLKVRRNATRLNWVNAANSHVYSTLVSNQSSLCAVWWLTDTMVTDTMVCMTNDPLLFSYMQSLLQMGEACFTNRYITIRTIFSDFLARLKSLGVSYVISSRAIFI